MTAAKHNIVIEQGATFSREILWKDSDGAPVDMTGYRVRMQIRPDADSATVFLDFDSDSPTDGMSVGELGEAGRIDLEFTAAVTAALTFDHGVYDLLAVSGAGVVYRLLEGRATAVPAVTR